MQDFRSSGFIQLVSFRRDRVVSSLGWRFEGLVVVVLILIGLLGFLVGGLLVAIVLGRRFVGWSAVVDVVVAAGSLLWRDVVLVSGFGWGSRVTFRRRSGVSFGRTFRWLRSDLSFILSELGNESIIGVDLELIYRYYLAFGLDQAIGFIISHAPAFDEVSQDQTNRSRDTSQTVHHDIGVFKSISNEFDGLGEVSREIEAITILAWHLQVEGYIRFGVAQIDSLGSSKDGPDAIL